MEELRSAAAWYMSCKSDGGLIVAPSVERSWAWTVASNAWPSWGPAVPFDPVASPSYTCQVPSSPATVPAGVRGNVVVRDLAVICARHSVERVLERIVLIVESGVADGHELTGPEDPVRMDRRRDRGPVAALDHPPRDVV